MLGFLIGTGILNLCAGYAVAAFLLRDVDLGLPSLRFPQLRLPKFRLPKFRLPKFRAASPPPPTESPAEPAPPEAAVNEEPAPTAATEPEPPPPEDEPAEPPPLPPTIAELNAAVPEKWAESLAAAGIVADTFVEAAVHVLRLEVGKYREQLISADQQVRRCLAENRSDDAEAVKQQIIQLNRAWLGTQNEATGHFTQRHGGMESLEDVGRSLEDVLLDQTAQIETTINNLTGLDLRADLGLGGKRMLQELGRLLDLAHALRDRMIDSLALITRQQEKLATIPNDWQFDALTGLMNRVGFEKVVDEWREADIARLRLVSLCLIDVDRHRGFNERLGPRAGDRLLRTMAQQITTLVRRDRGFDRVFRIEGQRLLLFLGDTGPRQAVAAIERMRQTVEAMTLDCDGTEVTFTISIGVAEFLADEMPEDALARCVAAVREAQQGGRNRTILDEGTGPQDIGTPPRYPVKARAITVPPLE